jgi:hypothetical protein
VVKISRLSSSSLNLPLNDSIYPFSQGAAVFDIAGGSIISRCDDRD